jgi:hypothetical protein
MWLSAEQRPSLTANLGGQRREMRQIVSGAYPVAGLPSPAGQRRRVRRGGLATGAAAGALEALAAPAALPEPGLPGGGSVRRRSAPVLAEITA